MRENTKIKKKLPSAIRNQRDLQTRSNKYKKKKERKKKCKEKKNIVVACKQTYAHRQEGRERAHIVCAPRSTHNDDDNGDDAKIKKE